LSDLRSKLGKHEKLIGTVASFLAIVMFFALVEVFISNLKGESEILIQPAATALCCAVWVVYAIIRKDKFLLLPNILGSALGVATVIAKFIG